MKQKLTYFESALIGILIFGLVFGAGNLIFPVYLGYLSGSKLFWAALGFLISAVGLPLLGLIGAAISKKENLFEIAKPVSKKYALFFTTALYLTIGPFFAIPRTCTAAFQIGVAGYLQESELSSGLLVYSTIFFGLVLLFSLRPNKILDYVGKFLTPSFIVLLFILIITVLLNANGIPVSAGEEYSKLPFVKGMLEGYNTMDGMATLAFAIVVISSIRKLGINDSHKIAKEIFKSGMVMVIAMSIIYFALIYVGATSYNLVDDPKNGGEILAFISKYYLGESGRILIALVIAFACLKTAVGLVVSCSKMFEELFNRKLSYITYVFIFVVISYVISNAGLNKIIEYSIPVLMFLYPLTITLISLTLLYPVIKNNVYYYKAVIYLTLIVSLISLFDKLPPFIRETGFSVSIINLKVLFPFYDLGLGWVMPCISGYFIGFVLTKLKGCKETVKEEV